MQPRQEDPSHDDPSRRRKGGSSRAGWRKKGRPARDRGTSHDERSAAWTQRSRPGAASSVFYHRLKLAAWGLLFLGLLGGFIYYVTRLYKKVPCIALAVTEYDWLIPPNAYAQEDIERLAETNRKNIEFTGRYKDRGTRGRLLSYLREQIDKAEPGGPGKDAVIFYISAHGALDDTGRPCLLPSDADGRDSSTWLPLSELLELIKRHPRLADSPRTKKLLILDAGRIRDDWKLGILYNGFADRLSEAVRSAAVPNLVVLNSTRPGQTGRSAPELGGSVFGYYVAAGLDGRADADGDRRVTVKELYRYLETHVDRWVKEHRYDRQQPLLIPEDADFPLAYAETNRSRSASPTARIPESRRATVRRLWKQAGDLDRGACYRFDPIGWARLQGELLHLEQLMLAGKAYQSRFETAAANIRTLLAGVGRAKMPGDVAALSLPLAEQLAEPRPAEKAAGREKNAFESWRKAKADPKAKTGAPRPKLGYLDAAGAAWTWLARDDANPTRADVRDAVDFVDEANRRPAPDVIEVHFLRMLAEYLDTPESEARLGKAIRARRLAEAAAAPADERTHYWTRPIVDRADAARRLAEDKLLVGTKSSLAQADLAWDRLIGGGGDQVGLYRDAAALAAKVSKAYRIRDRAWARIPYLAEWLFGRVRRGEAADLTPVLSRLIARTHDLGAELDDALARGDWTGELAPAADDVQAALSQLEEAYAKRCDYLWIHAVEDRQTLREIAEVLRVPLLTGDDRNLLRDKYLRIMFAESGAGGLDTPESADEATSDDLPYLKSLVEWSPLGVHPALAILDRAKLRSREGQLRPIRRFPKPEPEEDPAVERAHRVQMLARQGGEARKLLAEARSDLRTLIEDTDGVLQASTPQQPAAARAGLSRADRLARAAAGLLAGRTWEAAEDDPPRLLRKVDASFELLWQCRRTVDDFWGPAPHGRADYFDVAAGAYLRSAAVLCRGAKSYRAAESELLTRRREAAARGIEPAAESVNLLPDVELVRHKIHVRSPAGLPPGEAAVYVRRPGPSGALVTLWDAERQDVQLRRRGVRVGSTAGDAELQHVFHIDAGLRGVSQLEAVALYRGHVRSAPLDVVEPGRGDEIVFERPVYQKPRIKVQGAAQQDTWVLFILDCSYSMSEPMRLEGKTSTRLEVARNRLRTILERLRQDPQQRYRIGLMFYGHRAGWEKREGRWQPRWRKGAPEGLHPAADCESVIRLDMRRLLDEDLARDIDRRLASLEPWGETPLYYAIKTALEQFGNVPGAASSPRHIVVITDGVNEQSEDGPKEVITDRKAVTDMLAGRPLYREIRIDIIGLDMVKVRAEHPDDVEDLAKIAAASGREQNRGKYHDARDPSELLDALEQSLGLANYYVYRADRPAPRDIRAKQLGKSWTVEDWSGREAEYVVQLVGDQRCPPARVRIEGGEWLELYYNRTANRLEHRRYAPEDLVQRRENVGGLFLGAHMPERPNRLGSAVWFDVSVQNADPRKFSPRPKHVWAEIRPVFDPSRTDVPVFHFYDRYFEPDLPVPVLRFRVPRWPREARQAEIRLWLRMNDDVRPVTRQLDLAAPKQFDVDNVTFQVHSSGAAAGSGTRQITVTEQHEPDDDLYSMRVEMTPAADRIQHRYLGRAHMVQHVFVYHNPAILRASAPQILVTRREDIQRGAIALGEPFVVTLPRD